MGIMQLYITTPERDVKKADVMCAQVHRITRGSKGGGKGKENENNMKGEK